MVVFDTCGLYFQSRKTLQDRIVAIDNIIAALIVSGETIATGGDAVSEYQLNDGQTIIKEVYRGSANIARALEYWEKIQQKYINRVNGRVIRSIDSKNFRNGRY